MLPKVLLVVNADVYLELYTLNHMSPVGTPVHKGS